MSTADDMRKRSAEGEKAAKAAAEAEAAAKRASVDADRARGTAAGAVMLDKARKQIIEVADAGLRAVRFNVAAWEEDVSTPMWRAQRTAIIGGLEADGFTVAEFVERVEPFGSDPTVTYTSYRINLKITW
jgi:hypothetical protein